MTCHLKKRVKPVESLLRGMSAHPKLGIILGSKVVQKLSPEKKITKKWSRELIFLNDSKIL